MYNIFFRLVLSIAINKCSCLAICVCGEVEAIVVVVVVVVFRVAHVRFRQPLWRE